MAGRTISRGIDVVAALERGEARFREARTIERGYASHGAWPLGILALARGQWTEARDALARAAASFGQRPDRYGQQDLLARVKVAAGIAEALAMDVSRLPRARDLLFDGLEDGGRVPADLMGDVLAALESSEEEGLAASVLAKLLEVEPETLDILARSDTARRTSLVAEALLARASDGTRKAAARARDLRRAVELLLDPAGGLRPELLARAREAMDELEGMAHDGVGRDEFLELLDRVDLDPAWEAEAVDWARIGLLEAEGRLEDATACLRRRFNEALASGRWTAEEEAGAILFRVRSYNPGEDRITDMAGRLEAFASELGEPDPALPEELL